MKQDIGIAHLFCEVQKLIDRMIETPKLEVLFLRIIFSPLSLLIGIYYFKSILCVLPISLKPGFFRQSCLCFCCCCAPFATNTLLLDGLQYACPSKLIVSCHRSKSGICVPLYILTHRISLSLTIHYLKRSVRLINGVLI